MDQIACFSQVLCEGTPADCQIVCKGRKKAKQCIALAFLVSAAWWKAIANSTCIYKGNLSKVFQGYQRQKEPLGALTIES